MRGRLGTNMLFNSASAFIPLAVAGISTPLILDELGTAAFGVWTVLASVVVYAALAESGFGPALQRYVAIATGSGDVEATGRLAWSGFLLYAGLGAALAATLIVPAREIAGVFDFPDRLAEPAVDLLVLVGAAVPLTLLAGGLGNILSGLERFPAVTLSAVLGAVTLLVAIVLLLAQGGGLPSLGIALLVQQGVVVGARTVALRDILLRGRPRLASRAEVRELASFSARLQVSALSVIINGQSDRVVAGLVAPAATVGQLGVGAQVADAGRLVAGALLQPIVSRLSALAGAGEVDRMHREYAWLQRVWLVAVLGATAVGLGVLYPLLLSWLGPGHAEAAGFGAVLVLAYGINIATGIGAAYLRATGVIGVEARAGVYMVAVNLALTIPLAIGFGAAGVVAGTLGANVFGTAWFMRRLHALEPAMPPRRWRAAARPVALALAAGAVALGAGLAAAEALPRFAAILPVVMAAAAALAGYLSLSLGVSPRPRALRALLTGPGPGAAS